ncbi:hypothetical protein FH972_007933 [Carpinus fangiana]|uniref:Major facilitator superfamily (MFS) profile domain-containing protein n=1 Tax=Carpinus fangiana TaxID=176857 RepID=A0A5N6QZE7_9ROSI|nr:hypothetical protein FH972_007933 [Carpinus fangiana]
MGPVCDLIGPRVAFATLSLLTAPAILLMCLVSSPNSFIIVRFLVGFLLANFVTNQFWMSSMYSSSVVGLASGMAAGWANMGSGVTQMVMPLIYSLIMSFNVPSSIAWRTAFVVPSIFQSVTAIMVLAYGQDLPFGNYSKRSGTTPKWNFLKILFNGLKNYMGWILALVYGYSFRVELATDNIIAQYLYNMFDLNLELAGTVATSFGMAN